jgi:hypothetical protein
MKLHGLPISDMVRCGTEETLREPGNATRVVAREELAKSCMSRSATMAERNQEGHQGIIASADQGLVEGSLLKS